MLVFTKNFAMGVRLVEVVDPPLDSYIQQSLFEIIGKPTRPIGYAKEIIR